jgi:hypothetical protein
MGANRPDPPSDREHAQDLQVDSRHGPRLRVDRSTQPESIRSQVYGAVAATFLGARVAEASERPRPD